MKFKLCKTTKIAFAVGAFWFLLHSVYVAYDGLKPYRGRADIAIVWGNVVNADSSLSPWLQGRVDAAIELYKQARVKKIFASGGRGDYGVREGDAMKKYLLAKHIPADDIIADNQGDNSFLTAKDFIKLNDSLHYSSAIIVTSFYHISRCKYILRKMGFKNVEGYCSKSFFHKDAYGLFREFFAFYKYVIQY